jgi:RHS repeat-associated protein
VTTATDSSGNPPVEPPDAPNIFEAIALDSTRIGLRWTPSAPGVTYIVEREVAEPTQENPSATTWLSIDEFDGVYGYSTIDTKLSELTRYDYRLRVVNSAGEGSTSYANATTLANGTAGGLSGGGSPMGAWEDPESRPDAPYNSRAGVSSLSAPANLRLDVREFIDAVPEYTFLWDAVVSSDPDLDVAGYFIYIDKKLAGFSTGPQFVLSLEDSLDRRLPVYVVAVDSLGCESVPGNTIFVDFAPVGNAIDMTANNEFYSQVQLRRIVKLMEPAPYSKYADYDFSMMQDRNWTTQQQWNCWPFAYESATENISFLLTRQVAARYNLDGWEQYTFKNTGQFRFLVYNYDDRPRTVKFRWIEVFYPFTDYATNFYESQYATNATVINAGEERITIPYGQGWGALTYGTQVHEVSPPTAFGFVKLQLFNPSLGIATEPGEAPTSYSYYEEHGPVRLPIAPEDAREMPEDGALPDDTLYRIWLNPGTRTEETDDDGWRLAIDSAKLDVVEGDVEQLQLYAYHVDTGEWRELSFGEDLRPEYFLEKDAEDFYEFYLRPTGRGRFLLNWEVTRANYAITEEHEIFTYEEPVTKIMLEGVSDPADSVIKIDPRPGEAPDTPFDPNEHMGEEVDDSAVWPIGNLGINYVHYGEHYWVAGESTDYGDPEVEIWTFRFGDEELTSTGNGETDEFLWKLSPKRTYEVSFEHTILDGARYGTHAYNTEEGVEKRGYTMLLRYPAGTFMVSDLSGILDTMRVLGDDPEGKAYFVPLKSSSWNQSHSSGDAVGSRYRRVSLTGRPLADTRPEGEEESEQVREESSVDAFDLSLRHDTSFVYMPVAASDLVLEARVSAQETAWSNHAGLRPNEMLTLPFGVAWTSNLCAYVEVEQTLGDNVTDPTTINVIDENGQGQRFITTDLENFHPWPASRTEKKTWLNKLKKEGNDFVLEKKYGTKLTYRKSEAWFMYSSDRQKAGGQVKKHVYWRLEKVEDRYGNRLEYDYGASDISLIPQKISSGQNSGQGARQELTIQRSADARRVLSVTDAKGNVVSFTYSTGEAKAQGSTLEHSYVTLDTVNFADGTSTAYTYDVVSDREIVDSDQPSEWRYLYHYHANLGSVTDKRGNTWGFAYKFDRTKNVFSASNRKYEFATPIGGLPGNVQADLKVQLDKLNKSALMNSSAEYRTMYGVPRQISSVTLPAVSPGAEPVKSFFGKTDDSRILFGPELTGLITTEVTDTLGNKTFYRFTDIQGEPATVNTNVTGNNITSSAQWMVYYQTMEVHHGALEGRSGHLGKETFGFDLASGLSLSSVTDIYGNTTSWEYNDTLEGGSAVPVPEDSILMSAWADPTSKTDALGNKETYTYGNWRVMTSGVDALGNKTTTEVDTLGRPLSLVATDASDTKLREESYSYHTTFKAFMVEKRIKAFASASGESWETDLVTQYVPDAFGRVYQEIVDPAGLNLVTEYTYDLNNNRLSTQDPRGNTTSFQYDVLNRLTQVTYADDTTRDYIYDEDGNRVAEIDENEVATLREFDALRRLVREAVDMNGNGEIDEEDDLVTTHAYNAVNALTASTDANGNTSTMAYDALMRLVTKTDALGEETTYTYGTNSGAGAFDTDGWTPTRVTDPRGYRAEVVYDALHRPVTEKAEYATGIYATTTKAYDAVGNLVTVTDPLGTVTKSTYDGLNRPVSVTEAFGTSLAATTTKNYTSTGLEYRVVDPLGREALTAYDAAGRVAKVTAPPVADALAGGASARPVTRTVYDEAGNVSAVIDPLGNTTDYTYDSRNRRTHEILPSVTDATSGTASRPTRITTYDAIGNVVAVTDARGNITDTEYDAARRPVKVTAPQVTLPNGTTVRPVTASTYDKNGNALTVTDPNGHTITNTYDALNRLLTTTDAEGIAVTNEYDAVGNRTAMIDGKGQRTEFGYDGINRNLATIDPASKTTTLEYNALNKIARVDAASRRTEYSYDARHRLIGVTYVGRTQDNQTRTYDAASQLLSVNEPGKSGKSDVAYTYDNLGRILAETSSGKTHAYAYDLAGNRITVTYGGTGTQLVSDYDAHNRLSTLTEDGRTTTYGYDLSGNRVRQELPNGEVVATQFDVLNRPVSVTTTKSGGELVTALTQAYDAAGNLMVLGEQIAGSGLPSRTVTNAYDSANRLLTESVAPDSGATTLTFYVYDDAHNRTSRKVAVTTGGSTTTTTTAYTYNNRNQLQTATTGGAVTIYTYDFAGNRIGKSAGGNTDTLVWDYENRLVSFTKGIGDGPGIYTFVYDYRTRRVEATAPGQPVTRFVFSGGTSVQERNITDDTLVVENIRGSDWGGGVGGLLYTLRGGTPGYNHYNSRGDIIAQTDDSSAVTFAAQYEAFGDIKAQTGSNADRQRSNTKDWDIPGYVNEGFRFRDLETGSFLSRDPLGFVDGLNMYAYVVQNPWTKFDPEGLFNSWNQIMDEQDAEDYINLRRDLIRQHSDMDSDFRRLLKERSQLKQFAFEAFQKNTQNIETLGQKMGQTSANIKFLTNELLRYAKKGPGASERDIELVTFGHGAMQDQTGLVFDAVTLGGGIRQLLGTGLGKFVGQNAVESAVGTAKDHIALGIKAFGLEERAAQVGARTLLSDPAWRTTLQSAVQTPSSRFIVFLDGFEGSSTYMQVMGAVQRGATPLGKLTEWEMTQLFQAGRLETTTFMRGGSVVPNPFIP